MLTKPKIIVLTIALLSVYISTSYAFADDVTKSIEDALKFGNGGAVKFDLNYRYENVNQDNVTNPPLNGKPAASQPRTANANTAKPLRKCVGFSEKSQEYLL
jgi:hypothetical protein